MARAKVYKNIALQTSYFGLELSDCFLLGIVVWFLLTFNRGAFGINLLATAVSYFVIRVGKRGKPPGYTLDLLRYTFSRRVFLSAGQPDTEGRLHPFKPHGGRQ